MNIEKIDAVIEQIRNEENYFSMRSFFSESEKRFTTPEGWCGTPACIAGWAAWNETNGYVELTSIGINNKWAFDCGKDSLELNQLQARYLFQGEDDQGGVGLHQITRQEAIQTLEKLKETGQVDWSHCEFYELEELVEAMLGEEEVYDPV